MIPYTYKPNEEVARWATEVYIKSNTKLGWWIAFTNPTAGPWKKIVIPIENGGTAEIYRFVREEERPDLILVNDKRKAVLIVEAKDYLGKLITKAQMLKSVRVIDRISKMLATSSNSKWAHRSAYKIIPSFLWMCENKQTVAEESNSVQKALDKYNSLKISRDILNIVISTDEQQNLFNSFLYKGKEYGQLDFELA